MIPVLDLFSAIGCHAIGLHRAGPFKTVQFCEVNSWRRTQLANLFPGVTIHDDVRTLQPIPARVVVGGPPCQATSVAAAIHGYRDGSSLNFASDSRYIAIEAVNAGTTQSRR